MILEITGWQKVNSLLCYPYMVSVVLCTYVVLKYLFKTPPNWFKLLILVLSGIAMSVTWYFINPEGDVTKLPDGTLVGNESLFMSFMFAAAFHEVITRFLLSKFESTDFKHGGVFKINKKDD